MKYNKNTINIFFALLRGGLWEKEVSILPFGVLNFADVRRLAEEQSVVGLIAAGLEHVADERVPKKDVLQFIGQTLQMEQRNLAMNYFIGVLVDKMREEGIYTLLIKGQGIAQCYERPLWRSCGDVDFLLSDDNYQKAKEFLMPLAHTVEAESNYTKHLGMIIDSWVVELHGNLRSSLSSRIDKIMDTLRDEVINGSNERSWMNGHTQVFLPDVNVDCIYVFIHILVHFYKGGIGLRQICDWCRLLWTYRDGINRSQLENKLVSMGLVSEWKAFGAFTVEYLGMPSAAMPLYSNRPQWQRKAQRIYSFVMEVGNFGHNRDQSYLNKYPYFVRKTISFGRRIGDLVRHARIFPLDSVRFFPTIVLNGVRSAVRGE